jgi:hypothetical protein
MVYRKTTKNVVYTLKLKINTFLMHYYCLSTASADSFGLEGSADASCCGAGSVEEVEALF